MFKMLFERKDVKKSKLVNLITYFIFGIGLFYSTLSMASSVQMNEQVRQSLLSKLQIFAANAQMQVPTSLQDADALNKLASHILRSRAKLALTPAETQAALQLMQSLAKQKSLPVEPHLSKSTSGMSEHEITQRRIRDLADGGQNPGAQQMLDLINQQRHAQEQAEIREEKLESNDIRHAQSKKTENEPLADKKTQTAEDMHKLIQDMAQRTSEAAGNVKTEYAEDAYAKLSSIGKLRFLLDKAETPDLSIVRSLITNNVDIDHISELTKETPLHLAAKHGHLEAVKLLITNNAQATVYNWKGWTAAQLAEGYGYKDISKLLDPQKSELIFRQNTVRAGAQQFIGNWQVQGNANYILKIRRDRTIYINSAYRNCECSWALDLTPRRGTSGHFINYSKPMPIEFDSQGVRIHNNFTSNKGSSINLHPVGKAWYIETKNGKERLIQLKDDEDMYYRARKEDDVITRKMLPQLSGKS
ncbi:ankyrin repeat domain-containing protein [Alteromonas stellipolaris]|uniref:ankyrin repeat domain-containing protein n=1 Tax=Alteromonas stellipolaris TaxID=233316 RepID=UPI002118FA33|nr:ankyrin repeat domain-containing protein [Alteromonas stellipolaris]MCQ8848926.1 ankyrin repeat domain-containing protein [Alteromonas stellipolaris]